MKKSLFKIFFSIIFVFMLLTNIAYAKSIKFVQIDGALYGRNGDEAQTILNQAIEQINKMNDINFVVFTGDNIGTPQEDTLRAFIENVQNNLKKPFYIVVGDKDISKSKKLTRDLFAEATRDEMGFFYPESTNYVFKKDKVVFIVVDGAKELINTPSGYFLPETLDWVDKQLNKYKNNKVVILQHFPLANKTSNDFLYTPNALDYLKMLNKHDNVIAVVTGHFNINDEVSYNGVYHITTPSLYMNKCYKIIEVDESNGFQVFTSLVEMDK